MPAHHDASEFVDSDFQSAQQSAYAAPCRPPRPLRRRRPTVRPPARKWPRWQRETIKLAELKRAQEELERERAGLEELRRRQMEFQTGRAEMLQHLTRGIGLLEEAELTARRDADQMARTLGEFREAVSKVQAINEQLWNQDNFSVELTRALTTLENARMEWNAARLQISPPRRRRRRRGRNPPPPKPARRLRPTPAWASFARSASPSLCRWRWLAWPSWPSCSCAVSRCPWDSSRKKPIPSPTAPAR